MAIADNNILVNLRESQDNLRFQPRPQTVHSTPRTRQVRQPVVKLNVLPRPRLRLDEAFANAKRNQQTHVFSVASSEDLVMRWHRKPFVSTEQEQSRMNCGVADLIQMKQPRNVIEEPRHLVVKGEAAKENERRARGQLSLKTLKREDSAAVCTEDVRIRCAGEEALHNLYMGQQGQGVQKLIDNRSQSSPVPIIPDAKRAIPTEEARENWRRDHLKEAGQMNGVLDQGWPNTFKNKSDRGLSAPTAPKLRLASGNCSVPDTTGSAMAAILGKHIEEIGSRTGSSQNGGRQVPYSAAPNAAREGAAMAERFGLHRPDPLYAGDPDEISHSRQETMTSMDMKQLMVKPKIKLEGMENALRGHGTLSLANFPPRSPDDTVRPLARVGPEGAEIARSNQGDGMKFLLSHDRLRYTEHTRQRIPASARNTAHHARGGDARECLNPTRTKWSGKVHWKRRSVPPVHCTF